jgi:hypothetical protein
MMQWPQWLGQWDMLVSYSSQSQSPDTLRFQLSMWSPQRPGYRQQITWSRSGLTIAVTGAVERPQGSHCVRSVGSSVANACGAGYRPCRVSDRAARPEATAADAQKLARLHEF